MGTDMTHVSTIGSERPVQAEAAYLTAVPSVELLVCVTCRSVGPAKETQDEAPRDGAVLLELLSTGLLPENVAVRSVECLSNCTKGCTIALRGDRRWTYIYGNIDPAVHLETLIDGITRYSNSADGLVPWRERPDHFRKNCIARIPPLEAPNV
jgi:predicted metal-binding protein